MRGYGTGVVMTACSMAPFDRASARQPDLATLSSDRCEKSSVDDGASEILSPISGNSRFY